MSPISVSIWTEDLTDIAVTEYYLEEVSGEYLFKASQPVSNERFFDLVGSEWQIVSSDPNDARIVLVGNELRIRSI